GLGHPIGTLDDNARLALALIPGGKPPSPPKATAEPATPTTTAVPHNRLPTDRSQLMHVLRDEEGHLPDTPANKQLLEDVANDPANVMGPDEFGNVWSARILSDGRQVWTRTRNETIINGGINRTPKPYNSKTGLSASSKPRK
ncbi:MAG: hypothetical protein JSR90_21445, partial [Proteobacteria bacterium]|nr:hypothetical protein [Pseudomonadota bacterium]